MEPKRIYSIYLPKENKQNLENISIVKEQFQTQITIEDDTNFLKQIKKDLGEPHPFDFEMIEKLFKKFNLIGAVIDKLEDHTLGNGFYIKSSNKKIVKKLNEVIYESKLKKFLRPWFREALAKGTSWLEVNGLEIPGSKLKCKIANTNTIYVKRDKYGNIEQINQYLGGDKKRLNPDDIKEINKDRMIYLIVNPVGSSFYGLGIVHSSINAIDNFLSAQYSVHKLMERKANSPIHAKIGNADKDDYPEQEDIDSFGKKLQYMNNMTEWVTGPNCEMKVLDFGNIGDKFEAILKNDLKLLSYGFQVPEVVLGSDRGFSGSADVQNEGFKMCVQAYKELIGNALQEQFFDKILEQEGIKGEYEIVFERMSEEDINTKRDSIIKVLSNSNSLSPGMRKQYERKLAELDDIDFKEVEKENDKLLRRENREKKKNFKNQLQLTQVANKNKDNKEHMISHFIEDNYLVGLAPQEIEVGLVEKFKIKETEAKEYVDLFLEDITKDYNMEEWVGEYTSIKNFIVDRIKKDKFEKLKAKNKKDLELGLLNKTQIEKLRNLLIESFEKNLGIRKLSEKIKKLKLKDRYTIRDGKKILSITADRRADVIARTETVRFRAEGTLDMFKQKGVKDVFIDSGKIKELNEDPDKVIFVTTSAEPCPLCEALEGEVFPIERAYDMIPLHGNCRCGWGSFT